MTVQEIIDAALARSMEFGANTPSSANVSRQRIQAHQEVLFAMIADVNPAYVGRDGVLGLSGGQCDTALLSPVPMRITRVFVADHGTSTLTNGYKVNVVPIDDLRSALAPRVTLRDGILAQVGAELANVVSLRVYYAKRPAALPLMTDRPELPEQYHEILVVDLTKQLIRKSIGLNATSRAEIVEILEGEYGEILADLQTHLRNYNFAETARHGRTARPAQ